MSLPRPSPFLLSLHSIRPFKPYLPVFLLVVIPLFLFFPHLKGEYLYDDYEVIEWNPALTSLTATIKPSKPVANFFVALGYRISPHAEGQRSVSLFFHLLSILLFYTLLKRFWKNTVPFFASLFFAVHPVHSETFLVGWFRMEILGTFFTLVGCHFVFASKGKGAGLFFSLGLAALSKEPYLIFAPLLWVSLLKSQKDRIGVASFTLFWGLVLGWLLMKDSQSEFPYQQVLGFQQIPLKKHLALVGRSLVETFFRFFGGINLTTVALIHRSSPLNTWAEKLWYLPLLLILGLWYLFYRLPPVLRMVSFFLFPPLLFYSLIPNTNIGSQHYLYFPTLGFGLFAAFVLLSPIFRKWQLSWFYAGFLLFHLYLEILPSATRFEWNYFQVTKHPESFISWNNLAVAALEKPSPTHLPIAKICLDHAKALQPDHPSIRIALNRYEALTQTGERLR